VKNSDQNGSAQAQAEYLSEEELGETIIDGRVWVKTITAKTCEFHPERAVTRKRNVLCGRIAGEVRGIEAVPSDPKNPNSEKINVLVGEFVAESYTDDGEVFSYIGEWCGLPMGNAVMLARLQKMVDEGSESPVVTFDLEFAALPAGNPAGYRWGARNMMPVPRVDLSFLGADKMARRRLVAQQGGLPEFERKQIEHQP
jgi:hypothetical protein